MVAIVGLLVALAALIVMALRGVNIMIAALASSLIVIVTNDLEIAQALTRDFALGPLGAFTFAGRFFVLFLTAAARDRSGGRLESSMAETNHLKPSVVVTTPPKPITTEVLRSGMTALSAPLPTT